MLVFPAPAAGALVALFAYQRRRLFGRAFLASPDSSSACSPPWPPGSTRTSCPRARGNPNSLTVDNVAADSYGLEVAIVWWSFGMLLAAPCFVYAYRLFFRAR